MNFLWKKRSQIPPSGADHGRKMTVARLLGQRFLEKIQIHIRLIWVSQVKKVIQQFYWLIIYFGFNWGQSYLVTLVTPQNCTKMLRNLTYLLYNLHILASDQKKFCFQELLLIFFEATFEQLFEKLQEAVWKISSNLWKAQGHTRARHPGQ